MLYLPERGMTSGPKEQYVNLTFNNDGSPAIQISDWGSYGKNIIGFDVMGTNYMPAIPLEGLCLLGIHWNLIETDGCFPILTAGYKVTTSVLMSIIPEMAMDLDKPKITNHSKIVELTEVSRNKLQELLDKRSIFESSDMQYVHWPLFVNELTYGNNGQFKRITSYLEISGQPTNLFLQPYEEKVFEFDEEGRISRRGYFDIRSDNTLRPYLLEEFSYLDIKNRTFVITTRYGTSDIGSGQTHLPISSILVRKMMNHAVRAKADFIPNYECLDESGEIIAFKNDIKGNFSRLNELPDQIKVKAFLPVDEAYGWVW